MKTIRHLTFLVITCFFCLGCNTNEEPNVVMHQDVIFSVNQIDALLLKDAGDIECQFDANGYLKLPTVAQVLINNITYYPSIYYLNGKFYTQSIKLALPDGTETSYNISWFALLEHIGGDTIMAAPDNDSYYAAYVTSGVAFDINITPFEKANVPVDVLCYVTETIQLFGFRKMEACQPFSASPIPYITLKP
jgi:hypothetical protein